MQYIKVLASKVPDMEPKGTPNKTPLLNYKNFLSTLNPSSLTIKRFLR